MKQESVIRRLRPRALIALTLLVTKSASSRMDMMIRLIANLPAEPAG